MKNNFLILVLLFFFSISSYAQIPTDGLVVYYPFTNNANDESGNNINGIVHNALIDYDRFFNPRNAYSFNGRTDYIALPRSQELKLRFPFTMSLWFKIDSFSSTSSILFANDESDGVYSGFWVGYLSTGRIGVGYGDGLGQGANHRITKHSNMLVDTSAWHHIVAVFNDLEDIDLYIDCEEDFGYYSGSATSMKNLGYGGVIGRNFGHRVNSYHHGEIDDIRLYNRALSINEMSFLCYEVPCLDYATVFDTIEIYDTTNIVVYNNVSVTDTLIIDMKMTGISNKINIYPNPTHEMVYINTGINYKDMNGYTIRIVNMLGQSLFQNKIDRELFSVDFKTFGATGLYYVQVINGNNQIIETRKIIFQ